MPSRYLTFLFITLLMVGLACGPLGGGAPTEPAAVPSTAATPTLAPTATATTILNGTSALAGDVPTLAPTSNGVSAAEPTAESGSSDNSSGNGTGSSDSSAAAPCPTSGQNLLDNASFEGQYVPYGAFTELNYAPPWTPWWTDGENNQRPEFKPAEAAIAANRVHSGNSAQQYFKSYGIFKAGLYQSVLDMTSGTRLQFSAHGQAWSCEEFSQCPGGTSVNPSDMLMRVGIDPAGGTDPFSSAIIWSPYFNPLDQWQVACVEATAESDIVTVFLWASPNSPRQNQDVYWDDASLVILP